MRVAANDDFEHVYMQKFRALAAPWGEFVAYERDRAARDIGLHFTAPSSSGGKVVTTALAWFQLKGIRTQTLSAEQLAARSEVRLDLEVRHLKFWFLLQVPTYLVVYIECADIFLVINISRWIRENFAEKILKETATTKTVRVNKTLVLNDEAFTQIRQDGSIETIKDRINGTDRDARIFLRDDQIIKTLSTAQNRGTETRLFYRKWLSKMRSEVYFEQMDADGDWNELRSHWQYAMHSLEDAFPYLSFSAYEEEDDYENVWDPDEIWPDDILEVTGNTVVGKGGASGEFSEFLLKPELNDLGKTWAAMLEILEEAGVWVVPDGTYWISVAPFHDRGL
jgi:hypothetical protein